MYPTLIDYTAMYEVTDDFFLLDTTKWSSVDDGGTGTNTANAAVGGTVSIVTAGADNDYHFMKESAAGHFKIATGHPLYTKARFWLTEANTSAANFVIGLSSVVDSTLLGDDGAGPPASYSGALIYKVDGTMSLVFETSNAGVQTTSTLGTFTSGHVYRASIVIGPNDGTTALAVAEVYDETAGVKYTSPTHKIAIASIAAMSAVYGVKAGSTSAETLTLDYIGVCQKR